MWVSTHVLAGLVIAAAVGGPWWLVLILVLIAHVLMDLVPHWDYSATRHHLAYGLVDFVAGLAAWLLCWFVLGMPSWMAFMGPLSGAPDWDILIAEARGKPQVHFFPSHLERFPHGRSGPLWGVGVQVAIMVVAVVVVLALWPY
jgi:hypothetical protein